MSVRQTVHSGPGGCGSMVVKAKAPNGGWMLLEPFPDPDGTYRVDVLDQALVVLPAGEPSSARTKRWERHRCGPARGLRPERRAQQLAIADPP